MGININVEMLIELSFAEYIVLITGKIDEALNKLLTISDASKEMELKINYLKRN